MVHEGLTILAGGEAGGRVVVGASSALFSLPAGKVSASRHSFLGQP
jgi:hypothetical protein